MGSTSESMTEVHVAGTEVDGVAAAMIEAVIVAPWT
jgi:hypothetical protein